MELIDKRCRCGNLMHNVSPRQQICEECKKKKMAQAKAMTKSLQAENAALLLLVILLSPEQEVPPPRVLPPADTLPDKPIPMEHEHGT